MTDSPYRPLPPIAIPADHPLLDATGFTDLMAAYGPDAGRPVPEAGPWAGLMADDLSWAAHAPAELDGECQ